MQRFDSHTHEISNSTDIEAAPLPQKLYGRAEEMERLLKAYAAVTQQGKRLVMLGGVSGVGKSAFVNQAATQMAAQGAWVLHGKFEQRHTGAAYGPWRQVLAEAAATLLDGHAGAVDTWRKKLEENLGENGRVVTDLSPAWVPLLGNLPPLPRLDGENTRNRHLLTLRLLMQTLASAETPLVLLLDDWQWADQGSVMLLEALYEDPTLQHVLFLCAYRNNETGEGHPFTETVKNLVSPLRHKIINITLSTLARADLEALLTDTFGGKVPFLAPLTTRLYARTVGNALFVNQLLHRLFDESIVEKNGKEWALHIDALDAMSVPETVAGLMLDRLNQLPGPVQRMLRMASIIGHKFPAPLLGKVLKLEPEDLLMQLGQVLQAGLVVPIGKQSLRSGTYAFVHDGVQQACFEQIAENARPLLHLQLAEAMKGTLTEESSPDTYYTVATAYNAARQVANTPEQRYQAAKLNLHSATTSRETAAYSEALDFAKEGLAFMEPSDWQNHYELMRNLHLAALENAYYTGTDPEANEETRYWFEALQANAKGVLDKVLAMELRMDYYKARQEFLRAFDLGMEIIKQLDIKLRKPHWWNIAISIYGAKRMMDRIGLDNLIDRPTTTNPMHEAMERALLNLGVVVYFSRPEYLPMMAIQIRVMLTHGHTPNSPYSYLSYALIMIAGLGNIDYGTKVGKIGYALRERLPNPKVEGRVNFMHGHFVRHWVEPYRQIVETQPALYERCLAIGDFEFASYVAVSSSRLAYLGGLSLQDQEARNTQWQNELRNRLRMDGLYLGFLMVHLLPAWLSGYEEQLTLWGGEAFDERKAEAELEERRNVNGLAALYWSRLNGYVLLNNMKQAKAYLDRFEPYLEATIASMIYVQYYFIKVIYLGRKADNEALSRAEKKFVGKAIRKLKGWAQRCPENLKHKQLMAEAELLRLRGQKANARKRYTQAIEAANQAGILHDAALAHERLASLHPALETRRSHLTEAHSLYRKWGSPLLVNYAKNLLQRLEEER